MLCLKKPSTQMIGFHVLSTPQIMAVEHLGCSLIIWVLGP